MIKKIARWIIEEGVNNSFSGSWCVSHNEIKKEFNVELSESQIKEVLECLIYEEEVADVEFIDDEFDFVLYLSYVKNYEEE